MSKLSFDEIIDLVESEGYTIGERCLELSGYPRTNEDRPILSFDTYEELEEFCSKYGGEPTLFKRKDGWHGTFWYATGWMGRALTADDYLEDLGDDYNIAYSFEDEIISAKDIVCDMLSNYDMHEVIEYMSKLDCIKDEFDRLEDDEVIITCQGEYFETVKKSMMGYHHDTWRYEVGCLLSYFETEENNEDYE
jgi:hypothetical protein